MPASPAATPDTAENTKASIETCDTNTTDDTQSLLIANHHSTADTISMIMLTSNDVNAIGRANRRIASIHDPRDCVTHRG